MLSIQAIPAFKDNYIWLISSQKTRAAVVVDPGDAKPVLAHLAAQNLQLAAILITHHHPDHTGGIKSLLANVDVPVYGPANEKIPCCTHPVTEGDTVALEMLASRFTVIDVPGHTNGHIAYYSAPLLFCGDTLFAGGCGRLFEGSAQTLFESLQKLAKLPSDTEVYCTHEYTENNLRFALSVEPNNVALQARYAETKQLRSENKITLPSTLQLELATNPFLRCDSPEIYSTLAVNRSREPGSIFAELRSMKDHF